ncbi:TPA: hypothetical protein ACHIEG_003394 [Escherichia coli]
MFDIVKSPKVTIQTKRIFMSEKNKPQGENKPQPAQHPKPSPTQPDRFTVNRMIVGDSAEGIRKKGK